MKLCATCRRCFEDASEFCTVDGTGLHFIRPGSCTIADKYHLEQQIGRGGMGTVYAATHRELERGVAVKLLQSDFVSDPNALERFRREALAAARLNHQNVADVFDYGTLPDGSAYIVMELVEGVTLRRYLDVRPEVDIAAAVEIVKQSCLGVEAAHRRHIIHRDIKPSNIVVTLDYRRALLVKVLDFGIAKLREPASTGMTLTNQGGLIGTPRYMSPEQCAGGNADIRSDIYSLGVVLYELIADRPPFDAPSPTAIALKHLHDQPPPIENASANIPDSLVRLVMQALSKSPDQRPQTASSFAEKLNAELILLPAISPATLEVAAHTSQLNSQTFNQSGEESPATTVVNSNNPWTLQDNSTTQIIAVPHTEHQYRPRPDVKELHEVNGVAATKNLPATRIQISNPVHKQSFFSRRSTLLALIGLATAVTTFALILSSGNRDAPLPPSTETTANQQPNVNANLPLQATVPTPAPAPASDTDVLHDALKLWVDANNKGDVETQMTFYASPVQRYYLQRNVSLNAVRAEKEILFRNQSATDFQVGGVQITLDKARQNAKMRFYKRYLIESGRTSRRGEVLQELGWAKTPQGWKIVSERDVRVTG